MGLTLPTKEMQEISEEQPGMRISVDLITNESVTAGAGNPGEGPCPMPYAPLPREK